MPAAEVEEAVRAGEDEESCAGKLLAEDGEDIHCVVGGAVGVGSVEGRYSETGIGLGWGVAGDRAGEGDHGEPVGEGGCGGFGFEGLAAGGREEDAIEGKGVRGGAGQAQMAAVNGIECAAEEGYAHGASMVTLSASLRTRAA